MDNNMKKLLALLLISSSVFAAYILSDGPTPNMAKIWSMTLQFYPRVLTKVQMETMITTDAVARVIYTCDTNVTVTISTNSYYPETMTNYVVEVVTTNIITTNITVEVIKPEVPIEPDITIEEEPVTEVKPDVTIEEAKPDELPVDIYPIESYETNIMEIVTTSYETNVILVSDTLFDDILYT